MSGGVSGGFWVFQILFYAKIGQLTSGEAAFFIPQISQWCKALIKCRKNIFGCKYLVIIRYLTQNIIKTEEFENYL